MYENRRFLVIPSTVVDQINFSQVEETSIETLRFSVDGTKTFVKYDVKVVEKDETYTYVDMETGETKTYTILKGVYGRPSIYSDIYTEYNYDNFIVILATEEWSKQININQT